MKMRGNLKGWGRCRVPGHGQRKRRCCELVAIIREDSMTRAREKRAWKRDAA